MNTVTFSAAAIEQIKKSSQQSEHGHMALRIAATMTGDETVDYGIGYDEPRDDDIQFEQDGISILVAPSCEELLHGAHVDFVEIEPGQFHFIFLNPNDPNYKPPKDDAS